MTFDSQQQKEAFIAAVGDNEDLRLSAEAGKVVAPWVPEHPSITDTDQNHARSKNL